MPVPVPFSLKYFADLAGLQWNERIGVEWTNTYPPEFDDLDPFFDSLGTFDLDARRILIYQQRCVRSASLLKAHWPVVVRVVVVHFCARAVVLLGIHPKTGKSYVDAGNPAMMFKNEPYAWRAPHHYYDDLVRQELLFAQIFGYLWLFWNKDAGEKRVFDLLSIGHAHLYSLVPTAHVHPLLFRHWKSVIEADQVAAARGAAHALAILTRGVPISRGDVMTEWPE